VAIGVHIAGDGVTHSLAEEFRLRIAEASGLLVLAFAGMAQHAKDGNLSDIRDSQIEEWARWHGRRGAFAKFFRAHLCDERATVRAWEKYNGAAIRRAEAAKARSRQWREERQARLAPAENAYRTHTRTNSVHLTGQDLTEPDSTSATTAAAAMTSPAAESTVAMVAEVAGQLPRLHEWMQEPLNASALKQFAERVRAAHGDAKLFPFLAIVQDALEGLDQPSRSDTEVRAALIDHDAVNASLTPKAVRAFLSAARAPDRGTSDPRMHGFARHWTPRGRVATKTTTNALLLAGEGF
jgi:hypothetical protein